MDTQFRIIPKIVCPTTCWTWILPSSRQLGFLHLIIHVRYVKGQMMLIRCCFVITVMVDTISFASSQSSLKFSSTISIIHHVLLQQLDSYSDHATLFPAQVWGGNKRISSQPPLVHYLYVCVCVCVCVCMPRPKMTHVEYIIFNSNVWCFGNVKLSIWKWKASDIPKPYPYKFPNCHTCFNLIN